MSRSRKKAIVSDYSRGNNGTKNDKRLAAKAVRNYKGHLSDGGDYKRLYCSYNIHDWKFHIEVSDGLKRLSDTLIESKWLTTEEDVKKAKRK